LSFPRTQHEDYDVNVDYDMIFRALSLAPKKDHVGPTTDSSNSNNTDDGDNGTGGGDDGTGDRDGTGGNKDNNWAQVAVRPLPWKNAPKPDGSTIEFQERLGVCHEFMYHFAMHTPHYFLSHNPGMRIKHGRAPGGVTTPVQKRATTKKRKAPDMDEDEEGQCSGYWLLCMSVLIFLSPVDSDEDVGTRRRVAPQRKKTQFGKVY